MGNITRAGLALLCLAGALWALQVALPEMSPTLVGLAGALGFAVTGVGLLADVGDRR